MSPSRVSMSGLKTAIILAAGIGSRLSPETDSVPKCLVRVDNRQILDYQLCALEKTSINRVIIVGGYKSQKIKTFLKNRKNKVIIELIQNKDFLTTNNMYSLYLALKTTGLNDNVYFVLNGDVILEPKLAKEMDSISTSAIATDRSNYFTESMKISVKDGTIVDISKDIPFNNSYGVSIDFYRFEKADIKTIYEIIETKFIRKEKLNLWSEIAIREGLRSKNIKIIPLDITGLIWWEIDNIEDIRPVSSWAKSQFPSV